MPTVAGDAKGFVASVPPARAWFGVHAGFVFLEGKGRSGLGSLVLAFRALSYITWAL